MAPLGQLRRGAAQKVPEIRSQVRQLVQRMPQREPGTGRVKSYTQHPAAPAWGLDHDRRCE